MKQTLFSRSFCAQSKIIQFILVVLGVAAFLANASPLFASQAFCSKELVATAQVAHVYPTAPNYSIAQVHPTTPKGVQADAQANAQAYPHAKAQANVQTPVQVNAQAGVQAYPQTKAQASAPSDTTSCPKMGQAVTLRSSDFTKVKDYHIMNTLVGKVPGLSIHTSSVGLGGSPHVQIRGISDWDSENSPLYLVDGMPINSYLTRHLIGNIVNLNYQTDGLSFLNIDDIEDISVIKGFTPLLLNGNIGANGVVMITTKRGHTGKLSINYSNSTQFSSPLMMPEFQNTYGPKQQSLGNGNFDVQTFSSWGPKLSTPSKYDPEDFFRTGFSTMNSLSVSGGNKYNRTYASMGMTNGQNILPNNGVDRYNATLRNSLNLFDGRLRFDLGVMWAKVKEKNLSLSTSSANPLATLYQLPRTESLDKVSFGNNPLSNYEEYNSQVGDYVQLFKNEYLTMGIDNPYWTVHHNLSPANRSKYTIDAGLSYQFTDWLDVSGKYRYESTDSRQETDDYSGNKYQKYNRRYVYEKMDMDLHSFQMQANFNKKFNDLSLFGTLNYFYAKQSNKLKDKRNQVIINDQFEKDTLVSSIFTSRSKKAQHSLSSMIGFGYQDKYFLYFKNNWFKSCNFLTSSSKETTNSFLPNLGTSFILTDIFPIKSAALPYLKLNGSFGVNSDYKPNYRRFFYDLVVDSPSFEKSKLGEISLEGRMFNDLLDFNIMLYHSTTRSHFSYFYDHMNNSLWLNVDNKIQNKGIEVSLGLHQWLGSVQWNSRLNYSLNKTILKEISSDIPLAFRNNTGFLSSAIKLEEGGAYGELYGVDFKRGANGNIFVDPNLLQVYRDYTPIRLGNVFPKWHLSWQNDLSWKGFTLGMLINARIGGECVSGTEASLDGFGVSKKSGEARDNGGVNVSGYKVAVEDYYRVATQIPTPYVYSATNIRLAELSLGYDIPVERWTKFVKGVNVSFVGRNLLMLYCKAPFDPELSSNVGVEKFSLPSLRSIGFALNVRF